MGGWVIYLTTGHGGFSQYYHDPKKLPLKLKNSIKRKEGVGGWVSYLNTSHGGFSQYYHDPKDLPVAILKFY